MGSFITSPGYFSNFRQNTFFLPFYSLHLSCFLNNTTAKNQLIEQLVRSFGDKQILEKSDFLAFYRQSDPLVKDTTVNWRIYNLVRSGVIERIGKGKFRFGNSRIWIPGRSAQIVSLHRKLKKQFPFLDICVWSNSVFNEFMVHQLFRYYIIIEVEKDTTEAVFLWLKDAGYNAALNPSDDFINKYFIGNNEYVVVKPLISEAPLQTVDGIILPSLEKVLVDIVCDKPLFNAVQGSEMRDIYTGAFQKYTVLYDRLLRYAGRRGKREEMEDYLGKLHISGNNDKILPDYSI